MKSALAAAGLRWHGGHAYRRGLATKLKQLGGMICDTGDLEVLGCGDYEQVLQKTVPKQVTAAMQEFASKVVCNECAMK
jgi:hypothetical protein